MSFQLFKSRWWATAACSLAVFVPSSAQAQFVPAGAAYTQQSTARPSVPQQAPAYHSYQSQNTNYQNRYTAPAAQPAAPPAAQTAAPRVASTQWSVAPQASAPYQHPMYSYNQPPTQAPAYRVAQGTPGEMAPTGPVEAVPPGMLYDQAPPVPHSADDYGAQQYGAQEYGALDYSGTTPITGDCDCDNGATGSVGCDTGCCDSGTLGLASCGDCGPCRQWFAGFYGLYMERNNPSRVPVAFYVPDETAIATPYYPTATIDWLYTNEAETDGQFGGEIRFGSTFGCASSCGCCGYQPFAWEVGYWGLEEDESQALMTINSTITAGADPRIYGGKNMGGLEYDRDGAGATWGYRPLNDYYDYQMPVENAAPDDIRVLGVRVRQSFEMQNVELNFWKFGTPSVAGCGLGSRSFMGSSDCGSPCGSECGEPCATDCAPCRPPRRFFINGLCGFRYMRIEEDLGIDTQFAEVDGTGVPIAGDPFVYTGFPADDNTLIEDYETENELFGFQLGCSMNWLIGCKWNFFADSNFGVYGNQIDVYKRVYSPGGGVVRYVNTGGNAVVRSSDEDVAFLGEFRLGTGYQVSCNCRVTAAYRLIAVSGVALGAEQIPANWSNPQYVSYIDSDDSIVVQGLQTGLEWKY